MSAIDMIHDAAKQSRETGAKKFNPYLEGRDEHLAYELGWEETVNLYTRPDGQVFAIESLGGGEFQAVVPQELASQGEGACYESLVGALEYLKPLIAAQEVKSQRLSASRS